MNMSIVKPGILGRCFIFLVNAECVGIGCHWHGTQENTIFSWNLVLSSLYFILWLWKKTNTWNWNLQLTWGRHLRHCTNIATGVIPLDGLSPICAIAYQVSVCVCQKTQRIESTREGGRERERAVISFYIMPTLQMDSEAVQESTVQIISIFTLPFGPFIQAINFDPCTDPKIYSPTTSKVQSGFGGIIPGKKSCVYIYIHMYAYVYI